MFQSCQCLIRESNVSPDCTAPGRFRNVEFRKEGDDGAERMPHEDQFVEFERPREDDDIVCQRFVGPARYGCRRRAP